VTLIYRFATATILLLIKSAIHQKS